MNQKVRLVVKETVPGRWEVPRREVPCPAISVHSNSGSAFRAAEDFVKSVRYAYIMVEDHRGAFIGERTYENGEMAAGVLNVWARSLIH